MKQAKEEISKEVRIIGALDFEDKKEEDLKFIGVSPSGTFGHIQSIEQLLLETACRSGNPEIVVS